MLIVLDGFLGPLLVGGFGPVVLIPLLSSDLLIAALLVGSVTLLVGLPLLGPLEVVLGLPLFIPPGASGFLLQPLPLPLGVLDIKDLPPAANAAANPNAIIITCSICLLFGWLLIFWDLCL